jgi:hypothetical protein
MLQRLQLTYHVRIFIWICDTNVCQLYVQVLVHRMQCATYAETNTWQGQSICYYQLDAHMFYFVI